VTICERTKMQRYEAPRCYVIHTFPTMAPLTALFQIHKELECNKMDTQHKRCVVKCLRKSRHGNEYLTSVYFYLYLGVIGRRDPCPPPVSIILLVTSGGSLWTRERPVAMFITTQHKTNTHCSNASSGIRIHTPLVTTA
jgi:hypothetical protein